MHSNANVLSNISNRCVSYQLALSHLQGSYAVKASGTNNKITYFNRFSTTEIAIESYIVSHFIPASTEILQFVSSIRTLTEYRSVKIRLYIHPIHPWSNLYGLQFPLVYIIVQLPVHSISLTMIKRPAVISFLKWPPILPTCFSKMTSIMRRVTG